MAGQTWTYPSRSQCVQCHTAAAGHALGPELGQLNWDFTYPGSGERENQLTVWSQIDLFDAPLPAPIGEIQRYSATEDASANGALRARSYLHSNCSGCHRLGSAIPVSLDLRYEIDFLTMGVCNVLPDEGDLGITGARLLVPGDLDQSLISVRMHRTTNGQMPPMGHNLVDAAGTAVVDAWILSVLADCAGPDTDGDLAPDAMDNCPDRANPGQEDSNMDGIGDACDVKLSPTRYPACGLGYETVFLLIGMMLFRRRNRWSRTWGDRRESNSHLRLHRPAFWPLNYGRRKSGG